MKKRDKVMEIVEAVRGKPRDLRKSVPRILDADGEPVTRSALKKIRRRARNAQEQTPK